MKERKTLSTAGSSSGPRDAATATTAPPPMSREPRIQYRRLYGAGDLPRLQVLHDDSFPIRYPDTFYRALLNDGAPYFTFVAVVDTRTYLRSRRERSRRSEQRSSQNDELADTSCESDDDDDGANGGSSIGEVASGAFPQADLRAHSTFDDRSGLRTQAAAMYFSTPREDASDATRERNVSCEAATSGPVSPLDRAAVSSRSGLKHFGSGVPGEVIIGFIVARIKHIDTKFGLCSMPVGYISTFGVHSDYRRYGIGTTLLDIVTSRFAECSGDALRNPTPPIVTWMSEGSGLSSPARVREMWLHVWAANTGAIEFYLRSGYEKVELLRNYYSFHNANHDAFLMRRILPADAPARRMEVTADPGAESDDTKRSSRKRAHSVGHWLWTNLGFADLAALIAVASRNTGRLEDDDDDGDGGAQADAAAALPRHGAWSALRELLFGAVVVTLAVLTIGALITGSFTLAKLVAPPPELPK